MKKFRLLVVLVYVLLSLSEAGLLWAKKKISAAEYRRIGILVNRMTNKTVIVPMPKTTLETDYAIRQPTRKANIYIDHPKRLAESVPNYPLYTGSSSGLTLNYYKNFTPAFTRGLVSWFSAQGYEGVNFRKIAGEMNIDFPELSVNAILEKCVDKIDALIILHYMDIGNFYVNKKGVKSKNLGFGSLSYSIAAFDVKNRKRLFYFSKMFPLSIVNVFFHDAAIMNNPQFADKLKVELSDDKVHTTHSFSDDELSTQLTRYIIHGFKCPKKPLSKIHKKVKCNNIKGIQAYIIGCHAD